MDPIKDIIQRNDRTQVLIKWRGWSEEDNTWEDYDYFQDKIIDSKKMVNKLLEIWTNDPVNHIKNILKHPNSLDKSSSPITHAI